MIAAPFHSTPTPSVASPPPLPPDHSATLPPLSHSSPCPLPSPAHPLPFHPFTPPPPTPPSTPRTPPRFPHHDRAPRRHSRAIACSRANPRSPTRAHHHPPPNAHPRAPHFPSNPLRARGPRSITNSAPTPRVPLR